MIYVGIDIAKHKHDCCILESDAQLLCPIFKITNDKAGFALLRHKILSVAKDTSQVKVGLEATGHYSYNILAALMQYDFTTYLINPLSTNFYRKGSTLRRTKTDKIDARLIATLLMTNHDLKPYSKISYHIEELKSLTRYRFKMVQERAKLKVNVSSLIDVLFPEIESLVSTIHTRTIYALLEELPGASYVAGCHLTRIKHLLAEASRGRFSGETALAFRNTARNSVGLVLPAKSMELKHTIKLIETMSMEIREIDAQIKQIMDQLNSSILSIPGINYPLGAMIIAEIGDFSRFKYADKILAFAGLSPSTYQSGQFVSAHAHMEKRGSRYLRYALFNAARQVCYHNEVFHDYLDKKINEGKHYNVAISHVAKKLIRVIYRMELTGEFYRK